MMNRRTLLVASAATLVTATIPVRAQLYPAVEDVLFDPDIPVLGNPDGDVTIAEFFDYQCPYCKRGHPDLLDVVRSDGNIRLVMKDWPIFGEPSVHAASLVLAAGADYEATHNALMATPGRLTKDRIDQTLTASGHDPAKLLSNFRKDRQRIEGILSRNMEQANAFGFNGTPAFLFNTKMHYGAMRREAIVAAIAEARS